MLPPGEKLVFDPRTIRVLAQTLSVLNVAGNRLEDLRDLAGLKRPVKLKMHAGPPTDLTRAAGTGRSAPRLCAGCGVRGEGLMG